MTVSVSAVSLYPRDDNHSITTLRTGKELAQFLERHNAVLKHSPVFGAKDCSFITIEDTKNSDQILTRKFIELENSYIVLSLSVSIPSSVYRTPVGIEIDCDLFHVYIFHKALEQWKADAFHVEDQSSFIDVKKYFSLIQAGTTVPPEIKHLLTKLQVREEKAIFKTILRCDNSSGLRSEINLRNSLPRIGGRSSYKRLIAENINTLECIKNVEEAEEFLDSINAKRWYSHGTNYIEIIICHSSDVKNIEFRRTSIVLEKSPFSVLLRDVKGSKENEYYLSSLGLSIKKGNVEKMISSEILLEMVEKGKFPDHTIVEVD